MRGECLVCGKAAKRQSSFFCADHWRNLPRVMKVRWWRETDYGSKEPSPELAAKVRDILKDKT